jgi:hypothetical protein
MKAGLPQRRRKNSKQQELGRRFPSHRAWIRGHACSVPGCSANDIECAHVRNGTDGGVSLKPSDWWTISLCGVHHFEQHQIGEEAFEQRYGLDLQKLAQQFAQRSPHRKRWKSEV